jgi:hypothetical protein
MKSKFLVCFLLAFAACFYFAKAAIFSWTPRYTAQAGISINLGQMWFADENANILDIEQVRQKYDKMLTKFKPGKPFVSIVCENCNIASTESDSFAQNLRRYLSITKVGETNGSDLYRIQFSDNNRRIALQTVKLLSQRLVSRLNLITKLQNGEQAYSSYQDNVKIQESKEQSNQADLEQFVNGIKFIGHLGGVFSNAAEIVEPGAIVKTSNFAF